MIKTGLTFLLAAALASASLSAQEPAPATPRFSVEQQALLRCSVAAALVSVKQEQGDRAALAYPPLADRGREFFVRSMAQLMDAHQLSREDVMALVAEETHRLESAPDELTSIMPACLAMIDAAGL